MEHKLIITKQEQYILSCIFEEQELVQINAEEENEIILGNIYVGRVQNIVKNLNAAFIEIAKKQYCYMPLEENKNPIFVDSKNTDKIRIGDQLLVQVSKEGIKTKAPMVTSNINLTGKYAVLTHGANRIGISGKITDESRKRELRNLMSGYKNPDYGFILRTNCMNAPDERIIWEINQLEKAYHTILEYGVHRTVFSNIYKAPPGFICDIRDGFSDKIDKIITDDMELYNQIHSYLENSQREDLEKLKYYQDNLISLSSLYGIRSKLEEALKERVWLKSGGYLIIQQTEALTVIDVNTGKSIKGKHNTAEHFFKINSEAAVEISKQLRLRNLSGIIIVDFIDMEDKKHKSLLIEQMEQLLKKDPVKASFVDMTKLNLMEITRKKVRKPLKEQLGKEIHK